MPKTLAIIPARGGSKRVPNKNVKLMGGIPLIAHTILAAKQSVKVDKIIVSTDSDVLMNVAKEYGAEAPFKRPENLALDDTPDKPVLRHAVEWVRENTSLDPHRIVILRPTSPLRTVEDIDHLLAYFDKNDFDSVRSVNRVHGVHHPYWMYRRDGNGLAQPVIEGVTLEEYYRSQLLPEIFRLNGLVDVVKTSVLFQEGPLYGQKVGICESSVSNSPDIDTIEDFEYVEYLISKRNEAN
ncbi:cytidylyltransferase domain-containing protein [Roseivirga pacifica]|uniref:acylneuraminate cytidylyltransferase family protein n=1 Tax=Roseivirga pacifica TaxID=1267423 RepID=UPI00227A5DFB|nr:acylneuraminate cytidylyltransferase family protein [Roseivirga pacifica]